VPNNTREGVNLIAYHHLLEVIDSDSDVLFNSLGGLARGLFGGGNLSASANQENRKTLHS